MLTYTRSIPVRHEVDVFVAGGGPSGVAAAVAASRLGKTVFLAEATGSLGGAATAGLVPAFAPFDDGVNPLAAGIGLEIRKMVRQDVPIHSYWTPIRVEELKRAYDTVMTASNADYTLFTTVVDASVTNGHIDYVLLWAKSGLFAVKAKIYVDCTGDGDLAAMAGGAFELGDEEGNVMPDPLLHLGQHRLLPCHALGWREIGRGFSGWGIYFSGSTFTRLLRRG